MTNAAVQHLLASCAGRRERAVDEHMFTIARGSFTGSFRLQLFTGPGLRPVAVATQIAGEGGPGLTNLAETYAGEVWQRLLPDLDGPPVWIQLQLFPDHPGTRMERFMLVTFDVAGQYALSRPRWCGITDADLERLVGVPVGRERGQGYQPRPPQPEERPSWHVAWTALLPRPEGMDRGCLQPGGAPPWWKILYRQAVPVRRRRDCCYYHRVDWHAVCAAAARIVRQEGRMGLADDMDRVLKLSDAAGLPGAETEALGELLLDGTGVQINRYDDGTRYYINGRHRTTAMLEAGVRRTVIIKWNAPA
jgi:hypothetical protein